MFQNVLATLIYGAEFEVSTINTKAFKVRQSKNCKEVNMHTTLPEHSLFQHDLRTTCEYAALFNIQAFESHRQAGGGAGPSVNKVKKMFEKELDIFYVRVGSKTILSEHIATANATIKILPLGVAPLKGRSLPIQNQSKEDKI